MESLGTLEANLFQVSDYDIHVVFSATSLTGQPQLTYQDATQTQSFSGDEIRTDATDVGTLVSVTLRQTPDAGSTSFTLLVPRVNVQRGQAVHIRTVGITTVHRFSLIPALNLGQLDVYRVARLQGTATFVES
jgi:hypothetical protein